MSAHLEILLSVDTVIDMSKATSQSTVVDRCINALTTPQARERESGLTK